MAIGIYTNVMLYHYTSFESLLNMLGGIHDDMLELWASSAFAMNDPSEMQLGYDFLRKFLKEYEGGIKGFTDLYELMPPSKTHVFSIDDSQYHFDKHFTPFIISFSYNEDFLPMWHVYGNRGKGVCLGFDEDLLDQKLSSPICYLHSVAYEESTPGDKIILESLASTIIRSYNHYNEIKKSLSNKTEESILKGFVIRHICPFVSAFIKNKDYSFENEVRLMIMNDLESPEVNIRQNKNHRIIPYIKVKIPLRCLKDITLGTGISTKENKTYLESYLRRYSKGDIVSFSKVLYRI